MNPPSGLPLLPVAFWLDLGRPRAHHHPPPPRLGPYGRSGITAAVGVSPFSSDAFGTSHGVTPRRLPRRWWRFRPGKPPREALLTRPLRCWAAGFLRAPVSWEYQSGDSYAYDMVTHTHVCRCIIYIYIYIYIYICIYVYIYIYCVKKYLSKLIFIYIYIHSS